MNEKSPRHTRERHEKFARIAVVILAILILANILISFAYRDRAYPRSVIMGQQVGGANTMEIERKLEAANPLPKILNLHYKEQTASVETAKLGVSLSLAKTRSSLSAERSWIPILNLFHEHVLPAPIDINDAALKQTAQTIRSTFSSPGTAASISWDGKKFQIVQPSSGHVLDSDKLSASILQALTNSSKNVTVPTKGVAPASDKITNTGKTLQSLLPQLQAVASFTYNGKSITATPQDKAAWFVQSGDGFKLSSSSVSTYIKQAGNTIFGVTPYNLSDATTKAVGAVEAGKSVSVALAKFDRTLAYTYCTGARGVSSNYLSSFDTLIAAAYSNYKGWGLDGQISFQKVDSGCDFTVWLAAPSQMSTFGAICDSTWDCNVGKNVVVNFERWQDGTQSWNAAHPGDTINDYRTLIINHETGHQLGFYDNYTCSAPKALAPVMMQQSIDLYGCKFNIWPLPSEQTALRRMLGLLK